MFPLKDTIQARSFPFVTLLIIAVNTAVFLVEISLGPKLQTVIQVLGVVPKKYFLLAEYAPFNILERFGPIFTSMFLHGGWVHFLGNMWFLWIFGDNVEDRLGHFRYFLFYILSGVGAALVHIYMNPESTVPTIGASGAISGVMGAYILFFPHSTIITLVPIFFFVEFLEIPAIIFLGYWALLQLFQGTISLALPPDMGGVAWWAHLGGFVCGMVLGPILQKRKRKRIQIYPDQYFPW
jgi:membrane associated rhomboid family serine protease